MAYDEALAERIRALTAGVDGVAEKRMFGGLGFLVGGNLAIAASAQGGILVRVPPEESDRLVDETPAEIAVMRNRPMTGWLRVGSSHLEGEALSAWTERGTAYAASLPPKP